MRTPPAQALFVPLADTGRKVEVVSTNSPNTVAKFLVPDVIFGVGVLSEVGRDVRHQGPTSRSPTRGRSPRCRTTLPPTPRWTR